MVGKRNRRFSYRCNYLYQKDLSFASRPTNDGELYPVEKLTDYKGIGTFLDEMKEQCFDKYNCMTVAEAPGVDDAAFERYAGKNGYFSMIFDFGWENMEGEMINQAFMR